MADIALPLQFAGELSTYIAQFLDIYGIPAIFISTFFFGEIAILVGFILSGQSVFLFETVFIFSALGTVSADLFWYVIGRFFPERFLSGKFRSNIFRPISAALAFLTKDRLFMSLLFVKFLIGTRLLTILYLARQKVPFYLFIIFDVLGTIIFVTVISIIGWLLGKGLYNILPAYHFVTSLVLIVIVSIVIVYISKDFIKRFIGTKKARKE